VATIEWNERMEIGVDVLDRQHRELVGLLNVLQAAPAASATTLNTVIASVVSYTKYHFTYEENLMRMHRWAELASHIETHRQFVGKLDELQRAQRHDAGEARPMAAHLLTEWIVRHIVVVDRLVWRTIMAGTPV
jgi:hemerythrin